MTKQIPWLRVLIEGLVIVGSILLAFGIDAWWVERQDARSHRLQLLALSDDFSQNLDLFERRQARVEGYVRVQLKLMELLREAPAGAEVVIPDSLARALRGVGTIDPFRGTLDAMISSGRLDQLDDPQLRYALTEWPRLVSDVRTDQLESLQYLMREMMPFLATQGDFSRVFDLESSNSEVRVRVTPALMTMLSGKNVMDQWIVRDIIPLVESTRQITQLLQDEASRWRGRPPGGAP